MTIGVDASRANVGTRTGTEWYSFQIIRQLVARRGRHRVVLYLDCEPQPDVAALAGAAELRILRWPLGLLWSQLRLSWEMLRRPPDVLFVPAHTIPIVHPRRTVTTIHDLGFEVNPELYGRQRIGRGWRGWLVNVAVRVMSLGRSGANELDYHRWSARFAARSASAIITVSEFTKGELMTRYHLPAGRITVVHHGFDPAVFHRPNRAEIEQTIKKFGLTEPYVLYIGRLERKKGILDLLHSFAQARATCPTLRLALVGSPGLGWDKAERFLNEHQLTSAVYRLGWQPTEVYRSLLAGASALVFLSRYEGFGMPLLEAFAVGTPVVATSIPALTEVAQGAAVLVAPGDLESAQRAMVAFVRDPTLRDAYVARGRRRIAAFSWDRAGQETLSVLTR